MESNVRPSRYLEWALEQKRRILESLSEHLEAARADHHSRRKPIACGMTIHPAIGCSFGCLYCYVPDMGFPTPPRAYPLSPKEMVAALALNPYFIPGPRGTLVAFGSVTEPFMNDSVTRLTLGYLHEIGKWMGNPQQLSTKAAPGEEVAAKISSTPGGLPSVLISVTTYRKHDRLEPGAAPVEDRLVWGSMLLRKGVPVTLFLRPLIPGIPLDDYSELLKRAWELGYRSVILGSLRVTSGILRRLKAGGIPITEVERRMPRQPKNARDQVVLRMKDVKDTVAHVARNMGYSVLPASCSANVLDHGLSCWACGFGPCGPPSSLPPAEGDEVAEAADVLGVRVKRVEVNRGRIVVFAPVRDRNLASVSEVVLGTLFKRAVIIRRGS